MYDLVQGQSRVTIWSLYSGGQEVGWCHCLLSTYCVLVTILSIQYLIPKRHCY